MEDVDEDLVVSNEDRVNVWIRKVIIRSCFIVDFDSFVDVEVADYLSLVKHKQVEHAIVKVGAQEAVRLVILNDLFCLDVLS